MNSIVNAALYYVMDLLEHLKSFELSGLANFTCNLGLMSSGTTSPTFQWRLQLHSLPFLGRVRFSSPAQEGKCVCQFIGKRIIRQAWVCEYRDTIISFQGDHIVVCPSCISSSEVQGIAAEDQKGSESQPEADIRQYGLLEKK